MTDVATCELIAVQLMTQTNRDKLVIAPVSRFFESTRCNLAEPYAPTADHDVKITTKTRWNQYIGGQDLLESGLINIISANGIVPGGVKSFLIGPQYTAYTFVTSPQVATYTTANTKKLPSIGANYTFSGLYLVVVRDDDLTMDQMIVNRCVNNEDYTYAGVSEAVMSSAWRGGETTLCDNYITALCNDPSNESLYPVAYEAMCSCFRQQTLLDAKYGAELNVSVLCFWRDVWESSMAPCVSLTGIMEHPSYQTAEMKQGICDDPVVCSELVLKNEKFQEAASDGGTTDYVTVKCPVQDIVFPHREKAVVVPPSDPVPTVTTTLVIPLWIWGVLALGALLLLVMVGYVAFAFKPTVTVPNGPVTVPNGPVTVPNGPVTVPNGPVTVPNGPVTVPNRTVLNRAFR